MNVRPDGLVIKVNQREAQELMNQIAKLSGGGMALVELRGTALGTLYYLMEGNLESSVAGVHYLAGSE